MGTDKASKNVFIIENDANIVIHRGLADKGI
jgi:hypothetical protein